MTEKKTEQKIVIEKEEVMEEEVILNVYQKIVEVRRVADGFHKDTKGFGYQYVSGNQILGKIKEKMNELNLLLIPSTQTGQHYTYDYVNSKGQDKTDFILSGDMTYTWIDGDNPTDRLTIEWNYYGQQDDISKAYGSALTYSERYFLLKCLGLPTDEADPDSQQTNDKTRKASKGDVKLRYQAGGADIEKFDAWYKEQTDKGRTDAEMVAMLTQALIDRNKETKKEPRNKPSEIQKV